MRTLTLRGLVEESGTEHETGAILYRTTAYFLERLGLARLDDLPDLAPFLPDQVEDSEGAEDSSLDDVGTQDAEGAAAGPDIGGVQDSAGPPDVEVAHDVAGSHGAVGWPDAGGARDSAGPPDTGDAQDAGDADDERTGP
jgi:hypothetical protein